MGAFVERIWHPRYTGAGIPRSRQGSGAYGSYLPDRLAGRDFHFTAATAADISDAERNVARLDREAKALANMEALARILLRAESVASSRIEGLTVSGQRLLRAAVALAENDQINDQTAIEVLANVDAMSYVLDDADSSISIDRLLAFHRRLLAPSALEEHGGRLRSEQNWIGGTVFNPFDAAFVPPPPEEVPGLLEDLCVFCNEDSLPAVAQAAIAHAQFETIHPFADGNGRTGRALIQMILRRRGLITRTVPPVSLVLATRMQEYVNALQATRFDGSPDSPQAFHAMNDWIALFAASCSEAVESADEFERRVAGLQAEWKIRLGSVRSDAAALALIDRLPETPIVTTRAVERALAVSYTAANNAIAALVTAGVLSKTRAGRRNRAFEARELLDAFTNLERQTASVDRDTRISGPIRPVPAAPERIARRPKP